MRCAWTGEAELADRKPMQLKPLFMLHNALLSGASLLVLVLMIEQVAPIYLRDGFFAAICAQSSWTPQLVTLYIFNCASRVQCSADVSDLFKCALAHCTTV